MGIGKHTLPAPIIDRRPLFNIRDALDRAVGFDASGLLQKKE